jgi:pimeloyl-[acyl-carrier protein] methyl ester esterase
MTAPLLFLHGWGFDASLWSGMRAVLGDHTGSVRELGYFDAAARDCPLGGPADAPVIGVGHSLGIMQLLLDPPPAGLAGLVAINGFTRFSESPDHPDGVPVRLLRRMMQRLDEDADATVQAFRARCGLEAPLPGPARVAVLRRGLELLCEGDARPAFHALGCPVLVLAGETDAIAPAALSRACFEKVRWVERGGHLLPLTDPALCAGAVRAFAERLA